jgi:hypothetical protein
MKVFGYLEGVPLLFKDLLCNLSILELCSTPTFCTWCVIIFFYDNLIIWFITFGIIASIVGFCFLNTNILEFSI